jgi:hypothetical protein
VLVACLVLAASSARAQTLDTAEASAQTVERTELQPPARIEARDAAATLPPTRWSAPALHVSLAATFVGLQALDTATTIHAVRSGAAVEANPLVGGLANHPVALVAVKSALTTATVLSMHSFSKKHPKGAAVAMIALNAASALVVRSNLALIATR